VNPPHPPTPAASTSSSFSPGHAGSVPIACAVDSRRPMPHSPGKEASRAAAAAGMSQR
jgi:hypothetical protein